MRTTPRRAMRASRATGVFALFVCLILVGVIRSAIPDRPVGEYWVHPDENGIARTDDVTVELVSLSVASSIRPAGEFSDARFEASPGAVLVLGRFTLTAHGDVFRAQTQLRTPDGYAYDAVLVQDFPFASFDVGFRVTTTFLYEVPVDKLAGVIGIHNRPKDGLQPVTPVIVYALGDDLVPDPGEVLVPATQTEPVR